MIGTMPDSEVYAHAETEIEAEIKGSMVAMTKDAKDQAVNRICKSHGIPVYACFCYDMRQKYREL